MERIPVIAVNKFPKPELDFDAERDTNDPTGKLIKDLLEQEQAGKAKKHGDKPGADKPSKPKGKTLAEIEKDEGGPVKEALVGMAHTKRAKKRKAQEVVDEEETDLPDNVEAYEEAAEEPEVEEEGGVQFEPFNLKAERERGHFDEGGNYVEHKETGEDKDAWLDSEEAKVVSAEVRAKIAAQAKAMEAAERERRVPLTDRHIAAKKLEMAALMKDPSETVTRALKRLGGGDAAAQQRKAMGKREKQRLAAAAAAAVTGEASTSSNANSSGADASAADGFALLAGLADELLAEGETDIYDATKSELERSGRMWLPQQPAGEPPTKRPAIAAGGAAAPAPAPDDDDDDMFGDDDAKPTAAPAPTQAATTPAPAAPSPASHPANGQQHQQPHVDGQAQHAACASAAAATSGAGAASTSGSGDVGVDYASWPIKELRRFLDERGVASAGLVEKAELVAKVREVAARPTPGAQSFDAPSGYAFDPSSGYFYSPDTGMYYDTSSGMYCIAATGRWYYLDASGQFVEYVAAST